MAGHALILANPFSGHGPNRRRVERLVTALGDHRVTAEVVWDPDERKALLTEPGLGDRATCLVVAGGDGSIRDVINELDHAGQLDALPIATLPVGNENLLADELGVGLRSFLVAEAIAKGQERRLDLGEADGQLFTLMCSIGLDADVVHRMDAWRKDGGQTKRVSRKSYVPRTMASVMQYSYPRLRIQADGQAHEGTHLFVFNAPRYGGGLRIAPQADPTDGQLDWVLLNRRGKLALASDGLKVLLGSRHLRSKHVTHGRAASVSVEPVHENQAVPIQSDGDPSGHVPVTITSRPGALRVVAKA